MCTLYFVNVAMLKYYCQLSLLECIGMYPSELTKSNSDCMNEVRNQVVLP